MVSGQAVLCRLELNRHVDVFKVGVDGSSRISSANFAIAPPNVSAGASARNLVGISAFYSSTTPASLDAVPRIVAGRAIRFQKRRKHHGREKRRQIKVTG